MLEAIARCVGETSGIDNLDDLSKLFLAKIGSIGFQYVTYGLAAQQFRRVPVAANQRLKRMTPEWIRLYDEKGYCEDNPLIEEAIRMGALFRLSDIVQFVNLSPRMREFIKDMSSACIGDFVVLPVSSRPGEIAVFCFAAAKDDAPLSAERMSELEAICLVYHARYGALASKSNEGSLSPREAETIALIAKGKTNRAIGAALGISVNTVDTLIRRSFEKLGATTRVEAVLTAISRGSILP